MNVVLLLIQNAQTVTGKIPNKILANQLSDQFRQA